MWAAALILAGCTSTPTYIVEGTVIEVGAQEVVLDHEEIQGFMGPMTMPFRVADPALLEDLEPGHRVYGRIAVDGTQVTLEKLRVIGRRPLPPAVDGPEPLQVGEKLPTFELQLADGGDLTVGAGQTAPVLLTFVYSRCPDPEFCPMTVARLGELQRVAGDVRLVALTLDPAHDTREVLAAWTSDLGASGWSAARTDAASTRALAMYAALPVARSENGEIVHQLRWLALGPDGRLLARTDHNDARAEALLKPFQRDQ